MTQPEHLYNLFVSYADADRAWVEGYLLDALQAAGARVHSEEAFRLGVPRILEFERAIQDSQRTLLILSPAYLAEGFSQFTDLLAQSYGLETATWPVIPLVLHPVKLPPRLAMLTALDATDPSRHEEILARLCAELARPLPTPAPPPPCPYPGMVPFSAADARFFYGREEEIEELWRRLRHQRYLYVIGPSGCGKSSLVFAGLIPKLHERQPGHWLVREMRPGATPSSALAETLGVDGPPEHADWPATVDDLLAHHAPCQRLLLIVDQFEELFAQASKEEQAAFITAIRALRAVQSCTLVITLRADFYPDLMTSDLWPVQAAERLEIAPLRGDRLRDAIALPAQRQGVHLEAGLLERLMADGAEEPGALPMLQQTMQLLWVQMIRRLLSLRAYERLGGPNRSGLAVAVATKADATLVELLPEQQALARRIFLRLVQFGEGRPDTRRQQRLTDLEAAGDDSALLAQTLEHLADNRLLVLGGEEGTPSRKVDIAHEALIQGWPTLQDWLTERRSAEQTRRRLEDKAAEWVRLGRGTGGLLDEFELLEAENWLRSPDATDLGYDEALPALVRASRAAIEEAEREKEATRQRELKAARLRTILVATVGLLVIAVLVIALLAQRRFARQEELATATARSRELSALALNELSNDPERSLILALEAVEVATSSGASPDNQVESTLRQILNNLYRWTFRRAEGVIDNKAVLSPNQDLLGVASRDGSAVIWRLDGSVHAVLRGHGSWVTDIAFSSDGNLVTTGSDDGKVRVWTADGSMLWERGGFGASIEISGHLVGVRRVEFSHDGNSVVGAGSGGVIVWNQIGDVIQVLEAGWTNDLEFTSDDAYLVAGGSKGAQIWNTESWDPIVISGHSDEVLDVAISPGDQWIATASRDNTVRLWRFDGTTGPVLYNHNSWVQNVVFHPSGAWLLTGSQDGAARLWDIEGNLLSIFPVHEWGVDSLTVSPDGRWFVSGDSQESILRLWRFPDLSSGDTIRPVTTSPVATLPHSTILGGVFARDSSTFISYGETTKLWQVEGGIGPSFRCDCALPHQTSLALDADGGTVVFSDSCGGIIWNTSDFTHYRLERNAAPLAINSQGTTIAGIGPEGQVGLWNSGGVFQQLVPQFSATIVAVAFSADDEWISGVDVAGNIVLWSQVHRNGIYLGKHEGANTLEFGQSSDSLITISSDSVREWSLSGITQREIWNAEMIKQDKGEGVRHVAYDPVHQYIIISTPIDGVTRLWDPQGNLIHALSFAGYVLDVSSDGSTLAIADAQNLQAWDLRNLHLQFQLKLQRPIRALAVNSQATQLVVMPATDCLVQLQPLRLEDMLDIARARVQRELTTSERCVFLGDCAR